MPLQRLVAHQVRNLLDIDLPLAPRFNVFFGENGSGKTSILEACHILGIGRSFRHNLLNSIITHHKNQLQITGWLQHDQQQLHVIGLAKMLNGRMLLRKDSNDAPSIAIFAEILPLQLIHPNSDILIQGSPQQRRQFIDWIMFHVEPNFFEQWQRFHRVLKQRNAALKQQESRLAISCWDEEFCESALLLQQWRLQSVDWLMTCFENLLQVLCPNLSISLHYQPGWNTESTLQATLQQQFAKDLYQGYTTSGPQRDDLVITCQNESAAQMLSRGEQKSVVIALRLAQGQLLKEMTGKICLFLLDDVMAELDDTHRQAVSHILHQLSAQVLLTTINKADMIDLGNYAESAMFHVERGNVCAL